MATSRFDDDEPTPVGSDVLSNILFRVGATHNAVKAIREDVHDLKDDIGKLRDATVTEAECIERHTRAEAEVNKLGDNIREMTEQAATVVQDIRLLNDAQALRVRQRIPMPVWIGTLIALLSFFGGVAWGLVRLGQYMDKVDRSLVATSGEVKDELKQLGDSTRIVYVTIPADAGPARAAPPLPRRVRVLPHQ